MLWRLHLVCLLGVLPSVASGGCELRWPNSDIAVPPLVVEYIQAECHRYTGTTEESLSQCIEAELYGYRAVVSMLSDPVTGEAAAERYRACAAGLGDHGGRFHRRKAECIGARFNYAWRFEFSERT